MKAIGMVETRGLVAAIESADAMLKAADVVLLERTIVKGGLVNITIAGDVAAVKASVDAGVSAVNRMGGLVVAQHVIPRPHQELSGLIVAKIPGDEEEPAEEEEDAEEEEEIEVIEVVEEVVEPASNEKKKGTINKEDLDKVFAEEGIDKVVEILEDVKVVDLRGIARQYNGEFGIAGREITVANKGLLIEEFKKFYNK